MAVVIEPSNLTTDLHPSIRLSDLMTRLGTAWGVKESNMGDHYSPCRSVFCRFNCLVDAAATPFCDVVVSAPLGSSYRSMSTYYTHSIIVFKSRLSYVVVSA